MSGQDKTPTQWPTMAVPGWQSLYLQLQSDVTGLDPHAEVTVLEESPYLHLHVERADAAVLQQVREACFTAEGASIRTCATCGAPGRMLPGPAGTRPAACSEHAAMPERESGSSSATPPPSSRQPPGWPAERRGEP